MWAPESPEPTELGRGNVNYKPILSAAQKAGHIDWYYVEQEPPLQRHARRWRRSKKSITSTFTSCLKRQLNAVLRAGRIRNVLSRLFRKLLEGLLSFHMIGMFLQQLE